MSGPTTRWGTWEWARQLEALEHQALDPRPVAAWGHRLDRCSECRDLRRRELERIAHENDALRSLEGRPV